MKIIKSIIIVLIVSMGLFSCDSYLDVNDEVNNPKAEDVPSKLMLASVQNGAYSVLCTDQNKFGNIMMNQWAGDVTNFTGGNTDEYHYNFTTNFYSSVWDNMYIVTDKLQAIINKDSEANANYTAIAKILKSHNMQYIVDIYGDAPYTEAFQRNDNYQPTYDDAASIYMDLYTNLDEAINMIENAGVNAENPGDFDAMLAGDMDMWIKFANTLKLKLLVRAASSTDGTVQTWVTSKFTELSGASFLGAGENIKINPGYIKEPGKQNVFWDYMGFKTDDDPHTNHKFTIGSEYFIKYLSGSTAPFAFDNRLSKFFKPAPGTASYQGIEQGADDPDNPNMGLSFIGDGLLRSFDQAGWFFTASESLFLQAEAALNGSLSGDAQALFEAGITESFNLLGLSSDAAGYVDAVNNTPVNLEQIITQKWVALHGTDGAETFIEHARTGFPNPPLPLLTSDTHRPYRLMYPASEYTGNGANAINITRAELFTPSIFYQH